MRVNKDSFEIHNQKYANKNLIYSIGEYRDYVNYFLETWKEEELWYRGVPKSTFRLIPSIYRNKVWSYNYGSAKVIYHSFIHKARGYLMSGNLGKWEWYQIMQHYTLPTRLLDWTEGSLIALYFACRNPNTKATPCVWLLNPFNLNKLSTKNESVFYTDKLTRDEGDTIVDDYLNDDVQMPDFPIAIVPPYINKRMSAQRSCFTVHGEMKYGFENLFKANHDLQLVQLKISGKVAYEIKKELVKFGISESTLFPDLEGLAREIRFDFGMNIF